MEPSLKTRLLGAAVLIALLVLFVPMMFSSAPPKSDADQTVSLEIPPAPDRELQSRTLDVVPGGSPAATNGATQAAVTSPANGAAQPIQAPAAPPATVTPGGGSKLASVDIASRKPADALPEDFANAPASPKAAAAPVPAVATAKPPKAVAVPAAEPKAVAAEALPAGTAGRGSYSINLSAYADRSKADALVQKVKALGYPVSTAATSQAGKSLTRVTAGPFETRAAAEAARLKITAAAPGAPASLSSRPETQTADAPAPARAVPTATPAAAAPTAATVPAASPRAGGFAVQVAAVSSEAEATRLRDKLRGAGIAGYVDTVVASSGAKLWRVRAGPQTQRDDATRLKDQIKAKVGLDGVVVSAP